MFVQTPSQQQTGALHKDGNKVMKDWGDGNAAVEGALRELRPRDTKLNQWRFNVGLCYLTSWRD
jgi:hypothetical protein